MSSHPSPTFTTSDRVIVRSAALFDAPRLMSHAVASITAGGIVVLACGMRYTPTRLTFADGTERACARCERSRS